MKLELNISDEVSITNLTAQLNHICEQVEDRTQSIVILRFTNNAQQFQAWPGNVTIQDVNRWERSVRRLERLNALTIAVLSGAVGGPTLDLVLATDYRIATSDLRLKLPTNDCQVWPGMILHRLANQIGIGQSRRLLIGSHEISAQQALNIAMINEVTDSLSESLETAVSKLSLIADAELKVRRQLLLEATTTSFEDALGTYLAACDRELNRLRSRNQTNTPEIS